MNRLVLSAQVLERSAMRYTPAGLPAIDRVLTSDSTVVQDGQPRQVSLEIKAVFIGEISRRASELALGWNGMFAGFLAPSRARKGLVFHVTEIELA
jgi:primosomal replication protein N